MGEGHLPVLVDEVLASLALGPGSSAADCTVGGGGHAERLLEASSPDGRLLGIDADRAAIAEAHRFLERFGDRVVLRHANFAQLHETARDAGFVDLDAVLFDLGLSSYQLADPARGFAFAADAPPDMRFDEDRGVSALDLIDRASERELAGVVADHCQPAARAQERERSFKTAAENIQFPVHGDAQRLEGPRGRMDAPAVGSALRYSRCDHGGKVGGCHQATFRTRRQDRLRDAACTAFFTKRREESGELSPRRSVDEVECR